jgi:hypothetical protein
LKNLFQRLSATDKPAEKTVAETNGVRRTEITVEREWITEIWRVPAEGELEKVYEAHSTPDKLAPELLLPKPVDG